MKLHEMGLVNGLLENSGNLNSIKKPASKEELKEACVQFEALLLKYMFEKMRDTVPKSGFLDQGVAFDIVQSMHDEALTQDLAKSGGIGLAQELYDDLSKYI